MCYSAQILDSYEKYVRNWGADISLRDFHQIYFLRRSTPSIRIPKAIDAWFAQPRNDDERQIKTMIVQVMEDTGNTKVKTGWFSDWYAALKKDLGVA